MLLVEGTHYLRREGEPAPLPHPAKIYFDCVLCDRSDSTASGNKRKYSNCGKGYRLGRLIAHYQSVQKDDLINERSRTLFDMGSSQATLAASASIEAASVGYDLVGSKHPAHANGPAITRAPTRAIPTFAATVEMQVHVVGDDFWRVLRQHVDTIIKANSAAKVIPSAEAIAEEVMKPNQA